MNSLGDALAPFPNAAVCGLKLPSLRTGVRNSPLDEFFLLLFSCFSYNLNYQINIIVIRQFVCGNIVGVERLAVQCQRGEA